MDKKQIRRYPGVKSFSRNDKVLFKGRSNAIKALGDLIIASKTVLLYSKSGLGKTSLINAGLIPFLLEQKDSFLNPILIKLGVNTDSINNSPREILINQVKNDLHCDSLDIYPELIEDNTLFFLKAFQFANPDIVNVLIFDQFEDLFSYPPDQIDKFKQELNEILYSRTTKTFSENLLRLTQKNPELLTIEQLNRISTHIKVKLIFSIRSDYLSSLNKLTDKLPDLLNSYYELEPLTKEEAIEAIILPAKNPDNSFSCTSFTYDDDVIEKILSELIDNSNKQIETYQLQLVCRYAEDYILENKPENNIIRLDHLGDIKGIYSTYYENLINGIGTQNEEEKKRLRELLENEFVYQEEKKRRPVPQGMITNRISENTFIELIDSGLIKQSPYDAKTYELYHDVLVEPLHNSFLLRIAQEEGNKRREEKAKIDKAKRQRLILIIISCSAIIALFFAVFGFINKTIADSEKNNAERERDIAKSEKRNAENEKRKAESAELSAKTEKFIAEKAKQIAEIEKNRAIESNLKAINAQKLADSALNVAKNILSQLYFYDDKIAVAVMKNPKNEEKLYGFIDKNGRTKIEFKYDEASLFNEYTGFATVKRNRNLFLIDTTGTREYLLCEDINRIENAIEAIDLRNSKLTEIPADIFTLKSLGILLLSSNKITKLSGELSKLSDSLFFLDISDNNISAIPPQIGELSRLKVLNLNRNSIFSLPNEIGLLTNLEKLGLSRNNIQSLPDEIGNLKKLTEIDLNNNKLQNLPSGICHWRRISHLNVSNNQLTGLPVEIGQLTNLLSLNISNNKLQELPIALSNIVKLCELNLTNNKILTIPKEFGKLIYLRKFYLQKNFIESIPPEIGLLSDLEELDISNNSLNFLPAELGNLQNLLILNLRNNNLTLIPVEISKLSNLNNLDLSNNSLTYLPNDLYKLMNLKTLNIRGNEIPEEAISKLQELLPNCEILR